MAEISANISFVLRRSPKNPSEINLTVHHRGLRSPYTLITFLQIVFNEDLAEAPEIWIPSHPKIIAYFFELMKSFPLIGWVRHNFKPKIDKSETRVISRVLENRWHHEELISLGEIAPQTDRIRPKCQLPSGDEMVSVYIAGYGITSANSSRPLLYTMGLGPCVGLTLYNRQTRIGAMVHFYLFTFVRETIEELEKWLLPGAITPLEARLIEGVPYDSTSGGSVPIVRDIKEHLPPGMIIVETDLFGTSVRNRNILFNVIANELFDVEGVTDHCGPKKRYDAGKLLGYYGAPAICDGNLCDELAALTR
ncbi:hypothetical protein HZB07_03975 [Candidatus Saganbacteria bacterium]|nr:hypothetical protein [Candidatus Saganbacteria bacterium]